MKWFARGSSGALSDGPDLRHRVLYTVLLLLGFRALTQIPVLQADQKRLDALLAQNPLVGIVDLFAGGDVLSDFSMAAAGLYPYLVALALAYGATWVVPALRELRRQGEKGKERIERYAKFLTIPLAFVFAWLLSRYLARETGLFPGGVRWFTAASFWPSLWVVFLVTLGSVASMAIVRTITSKGLGCGESVVLVAGSSVVFVRQLVQFVKDALDTARPWQPLLIAAMAGLAVLLLGIVITRAARRIPFQSARVPLHSTRIAARVPSAIPMPLNSGGVVPVAGAMGVLGLLQLAPAVLIEALGDDARPLVAALSWANPDHGAYWLALGLLVVAFTLVCNFAKLWIPFSEEGPSLAESLKRQGLFIPNVRPGTETEQYLFGIAARITFVGSLALALMAAAIPYVVLRATGQNITVAVVSLILLVDTVGQLQHRFEAFRSMESYDSFLRPASRSG